MPGAGGIDRALADVVRDAVREELLPLLEAIAAVRSSVAGPDLLSLKEAAAKLGVSERTLRRRVKDGSLAVVKVGRIYRVDLNAIARPPE